MHGPDDDQARRRIEHVDEQLPRCSRQPAMLLSRRKASSSAGAKSWPRSSWRMGKTARAGGEIGHQSAALRRASTSRDEVVQHAVGGARRLERLDEDANGATASETRLPGRFVLDAELRDSSACRLRSRPPLRAMTSASTQPPETEPRKLPSASIRSWLPTGCGAEPQV